MYIAIEAIALGAITAAVLTFGIIVLLRRQYNLTPRLIFFLQAICSATWTIASIVRLTTSNPDTSLMAAKVVYAAGASIMCVWIALAVSFSKFNKFTFATLGISIVSLVLFTLGVVMPSGALIESVAAPPNREVIFGAAGWIFPLYAFALGLAISLILIINFLTAKNRLERTRHLYVLIAVVLSIVVMGVSDIFLPFVGIFDLYWLGPFTLVLLNFMMSVAMFRYRLLNIQSANQGRLDDHVVVDISLHAISNTDQQKMLDNIISDIIKVERVSTAAITIFHNDYCMSSGNPKQFLTKKEVLKIVEENNLNNNAIAAEEIDISSTACQLFASHNIAALAIIGSPDTSIIGAIVIGNSSPVIYGEKEITALASIANIINIAFESSIYLRKNEELQQLDTAKDELLSIASHNLRTPLVVVRGYIELILGDKTDIPSDKHLGYLNSADNEIIKMSRIIDDFLTLSRIQTGRFVLNKTPANLRQIVSDGVSSLQPLAADKNKQLKLDITDGDYAFELDDSKIRQIITNLIDNAIYYSGDSNEITIRLREKENQAVFEVRDYGIGVPEPDRDKLWQKFSRASNAQEYRSDGTGTGLYMVRRIVEGHDGHVIYRPLEQGSIFGFSLPYSTKPEDEPDHKKSPPDQPESNSN